MTKNEIQFLIESGFTLSEVIAMGTAQSAAPADLEEPARTEPEPEHEAAAEPEQAEAEKAPDQDDDRFKAFSQTIESLQTELKKLGDRIAAQGVRMTGHDTAPIKTIDETLAELGKKLNGG